MITMKNEVKVQILLWIAIISIFYLTLMTAFNFVFYDHTFYYDQYRENGNYEKVGKYNNDKIHMQVHQYLIRGKAMDTMYNDGFMFTQKELDHLRDVRQLLQTANTLYIIALIILIGTVIGMFVGSTNEFIKTRNNIAKVLITSAAINLFLILIILLGSLHFSGMFSLFHNIFFPQGNWMFPHDTLLILMYPLPFFKSFAFRMFTFYFMISIIILAFGVAVKGLKRIRKRK